MTDLYTFPADYVGRKTYVSVRGHAKSVACVFTYKGVDGYNHILPEYGGSDEGFAYSRGPMVMRDMAPYRSPLEANCTISSRSQHRDHMAKHNVIEVGNEKLGHSRATNNAPMTRAAPDIVRAIEQGTK